MKGAEIYKKAAQLVADGKLPYACWAITDVTMSSYGPYSIKFAQYFRQEGYGAYWFGNKEEPENQLARSLALLFMAEMEDDK